MGSDTARTRHRNRERSISIHAPAWGATRYRSRSVFQRRRFQSTLPHGERRSRRTCPRCPRWGYFNPRSRMGSDHHPPSHHMAGRDFNPRSRMGSDMHTMSACCKRIISIHAPAWGATLQLVGDVRSDGISIHAPAWGATVFKFAGLRIEPISIHAPAWGATRPDRHHAPVRQISIHAPAWGATKPPASTPAAVEIFQSTLPHGERRVDDLGISHIELISIHAPAWGATRRAASPPP